MEIKVNATVGEAYHAAMKITDKEEARVYFEALVERNMRCSKHTREEAEKIERSNLGYFAGYFDNETRERVERLFCCAHPVFGAISEKGAPTPEEAFRMGQEYGKRGNK
jgi:hypothetical protein